MKIAITGSSSELGKRLCSELQLLGNEVIALSRTGSPYYSLEDDLQGSVEFDLIVHLAWDRSNNLLNVEALERLIAKHGSKLVFVSTISANIGSKSPYAKTKGFCENLVLSGGGKVVRLGVFLDPKIPGVYQTLTELFSINKSFRILPFKNSVYLWISRVEDFAQAIISGNSGLTACIQPWPQTFGTLVSRNFSDLNGSVFWIPDALIRTIMFFCPRFLVARMSTIERLATLLYSPENPFD